MDNILWSYEKRLLNLEPVLHLIKGYDNEIIKRGGGKPIKIRNSIVLEVIKSTYRILVIDMCSFSKSLFSKENSLFTHFQSNTDKMESISTVIQRHSEIDKDAVRTSIEKIFGKVTSSITVESLDKLRVKSEKFCHDKLQRSRNHWAHRHERDEIKKAKKNSVTPVPLEELEEILDFLKDLFRALRHISSEPLVMYEVTDNKKISESAHDLLDIITFGSINNSLWEFTNETDLHKRPRYNTLREDKLADEVFLKTLLVKDEDE